jgi:AMMECR1 domain-containing protein
MSNGSIGSISAVSGLSNGLTEQAISAARNIRFEPAKKNGVAQTVVKQVQYSFTLY